MAGVILTVTPAQEGRVEAEGNRKNTEPVGCKPKFRIRTEKTVSQEWMELP